MGWLFYTDRRVQSYADEKREIARLCNFTSGGRTNTLLRASKVGTTWYAAVRIALEDGTPIKDTTYATQPDGSIVFAAVFLTSYHEGGWGYKDMEESSGPNEAKAPLGLLKLLSDLKESDCYAADWRKRCQAWADQPTYKIGDTIKLANPVKLIDGTSCQIVTVATYTRRKRQMRCYRVKETGTLVRLNKQYLIGSELVRSATVAASPVLAEFYASRQAS